MDYVCLTSLVVACASVGQQLRVAVKDLRQLLQRKPPKATKKRKDLQSSQHEMFKGLALTLAQRLRLAAGSMECRSSPQSRTVTSSKYNKEERGGQEGAAFLSWVPYSDLRISYKATISKFPTAPGADPSHRDFGACSNYKETTATL